MFPIVKLAGPSHAAVGRQHGVVLRERIRATWAFYRGVFSAIGATDATLQQFAREVRGAIIAFEPKYVEEMEGIAEGAGLEPWQVFCLNARTEVLVSMRGREPTTSESSSSECTSLADRRVGVLAQNWDWDEFLQSQIVVADIHVKNEGGGQHNHRLLTVTEPGMLAKTGLSSAGVGTALNVLGFKPSTVGVPVHVLLRAALDAPSFDAAVETLARAPRGTSSHIYLCSADGQAAMVEFAGDTVEVIDVAERVAVHTNHYLGCGLRDDPALGWPQSLQSNPDTCSRGRYRRAVDLVDSLFSESSGGAQNTKTPPTVDDTVALFARILADDGDGKAAWPICRPMRKSTKDALSSALGKVGTVCTVVLDLPGRRLLVAEGGSDPKGPHGLEVKL